MATSPRKSILTDINLNTRIDRLNQWIKEGRKFPNNYRNIEMISELSSDLIYDLVSDREILMKEVIKLRKELASKKG